MKNLFLLYCLILALSLQHFLCLGQVALSPFSPDVIENGIILTHSFAGGMNSPQFQTTDLDGDLDLDLVILDRSSSSISCFENKGDVYAFNPLLSYSFPEDIQNWFVLADYDCDGLKDLFTYTNLGIRIFKHTIQNNQSLWTLIVDPLRYEGNNSEVNIFFNSTDLPSISDLDGDGDLDILSFNFSSSSQIEFYKNNAIENGGTCGLDFKKETTSYGNILDCGCDHFVVGDNCDSGGRIRHVGGKTILAADFDGDDLFELVLSQEGCGNMSFTKNIGSQNDPAFSDFTLSFPTGNNPLEAFFFPASFLEDINFDGQKDLIVASNDRTNTTEVIDFSKSSFVYLNTGLEGNMSFQAGTSFLQDQMIDVGEYAYPVIEDINLDGLPDLIIGNKSSADEEIQASSLAYYESNGSALSLITTDLFELSKLGLKHINPQFIDLNRDEFMDLFFSTEDRLGRKIFYYILSIQGTLDYSNAEILEFPIYFFEDYSLDDLDEDGTFEILIGLYNGRLDVYGTPLPIWPTSYSVKEEGFLSIVGDSDTGYLSLATGDLNQDGNMDLLTNDESGVVQFYTNYRNGNSLPHSEILSFSSESPAQHSRFGASTYLAVGELLNRPSLIIGRLRGGVELYAGESQTEELTLILEAFPSPTTQNKMLTLRSNHSNTALAIYNLMGEKIKSSQLPAADQKMELDLSALSKGIYIVNAKSGNQSKSLKILIDK